MKRTLIMTFTVTVFLMSLLPYTGSPQAQTAKKKLYISNIKAVGVAAPQANRVKEGVKLAIFEGWGDK